MELGISSMTTVESVRLALGAASMRHHAIADNIANVNSPDHVRMKVLFEDQLQQALSAVKTDRDASSVLATLSQVRPELVADNTNARVELDEEMAALSANSLKYHALTRGLSRYFSIANLVVSSSRG